MNKYPITRKTIFGKILWTIPFAFFISLTYLVNVYEPNEGENLILKAYMFKDLWYWLIYVFIFLIVGFFIYIVIRKHKFYDIGEFFVVEKGLIFKKVTKLAYLKINTVSIKRSLLDLILKTAKLEIESGAVISVFPEAKLHLNLDYANYLKDFLEAKRMNNDLTLAGPKSFKYIEEDNKNIIYKIKKRELLLMGVSKPGNLRALIIVSIVVTSILNFLFVNARNNPESVVENEFITILIGVVFTLFILIVLVIFDYFKYYNYKLTLNDDLLKYEYGLLSKTSFAFDKTKINALYIKRSLLYRLFNKYSLEISVIGIGDDYQNNKNKQKESKYLLPIGNKDKLENILKILNAEELLNNDLERPVNYIRLNLIIMPLIIPTILLSFLITLVLLQENMYYLILTNIIFIYFIYLIYLFLRYKYHGYKLKDKLLVRSGAFTISQALIKKESIQQISFNNGPIRRLLKIGDIKFHYRSFLKVETIKGFIYDDFINSNNIVFKDEEE